ncbi:unnamed protein product [Ectocarpus sp. CCAP 1310/34]|nr:unnamed protein product [Ectocarpus sp. CCAP 1310/34]
MVWLGPLQQQGLEQEPEPHIEPVRPAMAMPLPEELMSSVLVFLRMKDMLQWRVVSSSTKAMWASESQVSRVARRVSVDLHLTLSKLKAISLLAPSPRLDGTQPVANRDVHSSKWGKALNIGHKGAAGHVEGNTMPSFLEAVRLGVDVIEFDVLTTSDGVVICHHDPLIEESGEWIENLTLAQTRERLKHNVSTFEEMLQEKVLSESGVHLYIDMKHTEIVRPVLHAVMQAVDRWGWTADRLVVATFRQLDLLQVNAYRQAIPELANLRTACIMDGGPLTLARDFKALKVDILSTGKDHVSPDLVADCQRRGIQVWVWTVNSLHFMERLLKMGVDGLCTDYPGLVHESNRRLRPQASQTDAATFPFPQGPGAYSGVDLRGLAAPASSEGKAVGSTALDSDGNNSSSTASMSGSDGGSRSNRSHSSVSSHTGSTTTNKAEDSTDATVLGGWYSRCDTCEESAEGSDQQRLIAALYGDLAGVRDFAVRTVEDAKVLVKVCSRAVAVESFLAGDAMKGKRATRELAAATALSKEAETLAEQTLRPFVSSAETFKWSVDLISTAQGREFMSQLTRSMKRDEVLPMLPFEKAFVKDLLGMVFS